MTQIADIVAQQIGEEIQNMSLDLIAGKAKDYADYKYYCGIIRGLTKANNLADELAQQVERADE